MSAPENLRELLELAAKAAGISLHIWGEPGAENFAIMPPVDGRVQRWAPHLDDGDSRRLQVACGISGCVRARASCTAEDGAGDIIHATRDVENGDKGAAMRWAVLDVAAEMGRRMP